MQGNGEMWWRLESEGGKGYVWWQQRLGCRGEITSNQNNFDKNTNTEIVEICAQLIGY